MPATCNLQRTLLFDTTMETGDRRNQGSEQKEHNERANERTSSDHVETGYDVEITA